MCRASALPVDHEGSAIDLHRHFLLASGRHPMCELHTATRVGPEECHRHWLCRWDHTGGFLCDSCLCSHFLAALAGLIDQQLNCIYIIYCTILNHGSHYTGISLAHNRLVVHQCFINKVYMCVYALFVTFLLRNIINTCFLSAIKALNWASHWSGCPCHIHNTHTNAVITLLLP